MVTISRWVSELRVAVTTWIRYYIFFCSPVFFISGLVVGQSIVGYAVVAVLVSYHTDNWKNANLSKAVVIVNAKEGLCSVLMIVVAHTADTYHLGRFKMVSFSALAYVVGLMILWRLNPANDIGIFLMVMVLIAFGQAGREPPLRAFLADQLRNKDQDQCLDNIYEEKLQARTRLWWGFLHLLGAIVATLFLADLSWQKKFFVSEIVMGFALLLFLCGFTFYFHEKPTGSPLITVFKVFMAAISKRHLEYSNEPNDYYKNDSEQLPLKPNIPFSRWLDKAALVVETSSINAEEREEEGNFCTVTQVKEVKPFLRMLPIWATFLVYCLVDATGSTFFFVQSCNLDNHIGAKKVPIVTFYLIQNFLKYAISLTYGLLIPKMWSNGKKLHAMKVRIGIGMACSCLCCITARLVEVRRLENVPKEISMSIFWLTPQFCLLGLMEGLAEDGLVDFFYYQVSGSVKSYGPSFNEFILGIGKFLSIFYVLTYQSWFGDTVNHSHLDHYYGNLALVSLGNLCLVYGYVSKYVYKDTKGEDVNMNESLEEVIIGIHSTGNR